MYTTIKLEMHSYSFTAFFIITLRIELTLVVNIAICCLKMTPITVINYLQYT